jgi:2-hydroxychromene-2-carboxylate isomerase
MNDPLEIDVFWSFRSPWSYLATRRLRQWQSDYELVVNFRPVYPIAIRTPEFFQQVQGQWFSYFLTDVFRVAEYLNLPFAWAEPDPIVQYVDEAGQRRTGKEQPYIHRLTRLGVLAAEHGKGIEFADEVSSIIWGGTINWHEGRHLAEAASRVGLSLEEIDQQARDEESRLESIIAQNQADHETAGHWGVPTCAFKGEPFFGQDRLDVLLWRLKQAGLKSR